MGDSSSSEAEPQWSTDGRWWWDGQTWIPAEAVNGRQTHTSDANSESVRDAVASTRPGGALAEPLPPGDLSSGGQDEEETIIARPEGSPTPVLELRGRGGQVEVYSEKLVIRRKGALAKMTQGFFAGEKNIYYRQIGSVKVKRAGMMTNGFIQFAPVGNVEHKRGLSKQTHDENTVFFIAKQNDLVRQIQAYVEERMANPGQNGTKPALAVDKFDQLRKLGELRTSGILSEDEFGREKAKLLR
jgi:hypothetical protein